MDGLAPLFASLVTRDVHHRFFNSKAYRCVGGIALPTVWRRMDILLSAQTPSDLSYFRELQLRNEPGEPDSWSILLHGPRRLHFRWFDGPVYLKIK